MAAVTTFIAATAVAASTAAAVDQRRKSRKASREAREQRADERLAQQAKERELDGIKQRDEVSRSMFEQRRRQRAVAGLASGRQSTNTTGLGIYGGFPSGTKTAMGA